LVGRLAPPNETETDELCKELGGRTVTRITVILPSGRVVGDSHENPEQMDNHADRPEIKVALDGGTGMSTRPSATLQKDMMYVAVPVRAAGRIVAVVRTSLPLISIDRSLNMMYVRIGAGGVIAALAAAAVSLAVSARISRPLRELRRGAEQFSRGDLSHPLPVPASQEMATLAESMNEMASRLDDRIRTVVRQRNEQEAVLASMTEGVLAVDTDEHVITVNRAAADLIGIDPEQAEGQSIQEAVRIPDLQEFVATALTSREPVEDEMVLCERDRDVYVRAHGAVLRDVQGQRVGAVIVLTDVTRLQRLEYMRRDFVANVSHELKTPVTSIKGFVETLLDGAVDEPENARRFLGTIARQADRLNAIIEDLLTLSRIERETDAAEIVLERGKVKGILNAACQDCEVKAAEKDMTIELTCDDELEVNRNPVLLEQAVSNLIDNAIKYSEPDSTVWVNAVPTDSELVISIRDEGCGVEQRHLSRLFERFYRVDKARSRQEGGTGLGLAIVKHIAQAHGGRATVESTRAKGSVFSIHLPCA